MALKVNPMELADLDAVLGLQDHIILIDTADLTVHTKKDITVAGGIIILFIILAVCFSGGPNRTGNFGVSVFSVR